MQRNDQTEEDLIPKTEGRMPKEIYFGWDYSSKRLYEATNVMQAAILVMGNNTGNQWRNTYKSTSKRAEFSMGD